MKKIDEQRLQLDSDTGIIGVFDAPVESPMVVLRHEPSGKIYKLASVSLYEAEGGPYIIPDKVEITATVLSGKWSINDWKSISTKSLCLIYPDAKVVKFDEENPNKDMLSLGGRRTIMRENMIYELNKKAR